MTVNYKIIGNRIKELRKTKGWTQATLAEISGIEPSNISHIERAATKVSLPTLLSIANALNTTLDELVYTNLKKSTHISSKIIEELLKDCTPQELSAIAEVIKTTKTVLRTEK